MTINIIHDCDGVDWQELVRILKQVKMGHHPPDVHKQAFEASHTTIFIYEDSRLIGFGRAISDGAYQAAIYDCAVHPDFQGRGIGEILIKNIMAPIAHCNVILYASPGKEGFYQKYGFRRMKTGMAGFQNAEYMAQRGFIE